MNLTTKLRLKKISLKKNNRALHHLEQVTTSEGLLDSKSTIGLPQVVGVSEHSDSARDSLDDAGNSGSLLGLSRDSSTIVGTGRRPASLKNPTCLSRATS